MKAQKKIKNVLEFLLSPFSIIFNVSNVACERRNGSYISSELLFVTFLISPRMKGCVMILICCVDEPEGFCGFFFVKKQRFWLLQTLGLEIVKALPVRRNLMDPFMA